MESVSCNIIIHFEMKRSSGNILLQKRKQKCHWSLHCSSPPFSKKILKLVGCCNESCKNKITD